MYVHTTRRILITGTAVDAGTEVRAKRTQMASFGPRVLVHLVGVGETWVAPSALDVPLGDLPAPRGI
ncbi:Uncharacterised protein [Mycobacteroides abscessus subsp. abscessus]|nr:Uncharacterised protein [Mycobacteroides abscessus subsp. abscessus]